jgi:hypothetical protein
MDRQAPERGYILMDIIVGFVLFGLVLLIIYQLYISTFLVYQNVNDRLAVQQGVRLALDRIAAALHETTLAFGRVRVYAARDGCTDAYEGCIGFVTAREGQCTGIFQLVNGAPDWRAVIYVWRDTASHELRLRCEEGVTFPVETWPPRPGPYAVIGTHVAAAAFTLQPGGDPTPTSVTVALEEEAPTASGVASGSAVHAFSQTVFMPQNP